MPKFTWSERFEIKNIVAYLSIKRLAGQQIIPEVVRKFRKPITEKYIYNVRQ